jgi:putative DNA primase/helicase
MITESPQNHEPSEEQAAIANAAFDTCYDWPPDAKPPPIEDSGDNGEPTDKPKYTAGMHDRGNGERLAALHGADLRYCWPWKKWLIWDGRRWKTDDSGAIAARAKSTVRSIYKEAAACEDDLKRDRLGKWAAKSEKREAMSAMVDLARSEAGIPILPDQLDTHPWLLNCQNGTLDLRTGKLRQHRQADRLTQLLPHDYIPDAKAPRWIQFLEEVFLGNQELIQFVQRLCGYLLTGSTQDHVLPIFHGKGANGKSVLVETILSVMDRDYAMKGHHDFLMAKSGGHPTDTADLFGKRFVACTESDEGKNLAESFIKELTGGDRLRARRMREDFWEFIATHKVLLATNSKPQIRGTNEGIWRRICLIPFDASFRGAEADPKLTEKLRSELPGILAWCVQGCLDWQCIGLDRPDEVNIATSEYRQDEDLIGKFVEECCTQDANDCEGATNLYRAYREYSGSDTKQTAFGKALVERGFDKAKLSGRVTYIRIGLRPEFAAKEK